MSSSPAAVMARTRPSITDRANPDATAAAAVSPPGSAGTASTDVVPPSARCVPRSRSKCSGARSRSRASAMTMTSSASIPSSMSASSGTVAARRSSGPGFSDLPDCPGRALCGSHLIHSHSGPTPATAMATSSGWCDAATWATIARTSARAGSASPPTDTTGKARRSTATGRSGTVRADRTTWRSATADTGSSFSGAATAGGVTGVAGWCGPVPMRAAPKSSSPGPRSHSRRVPANVHASRGSG